MTMALPPKNENFFAAKSKIDCQHFFFKKSFSSKGAGRDKPEQQTGAVRRAGKVKQRKVVEYNLVCSGETSEMSLRSDECFCEPLDLQPVISQLCFLFKPSCCMLQHLPDHLCYFYDQLALNVAT